MIIATTAEDAGRALAEEITTAGGRASVVTMDTLEQDDWDQVVALAEQTHGGLHILVNAAGSDDTAAFPEVDLEAWNRVFESNLVGTVRGIQTCDPLIRKSGGGSIINLGSVAGLAGSPSTAYSAAKWGLEGLSRAAAYIYADWGIRCNTIQAGLIDTDPARPDAPRPDDDQQPAGSNVLLRRPGRPDDVGYAALFLASEDSAYITGNDMIVDGGWLSAAPYLATNPTRHTRPAAGGPGHAQG